jgi:hypothetical protein
MDGLDMTCCAMFMTAGLFMNDAIIGLLARFANIGLFIKLEKSGMPPALAAAGLRSQPPSPVKRPRHQRHRPLQPSIASSTSAPASVSSGGGGEGHGVSEVGLVVGIGGLEGKSWAIAFLDCLTKPTVC